MQADIERYETGPDRLRRAIAGIAPADLLRPWPADAGVGLWSVQQVVVHLMDSDLIGSDRMKRIIAENNPLLVGYSENLFCQRLFYDDQPIADAVAIFDLNRRLFARVLRKLGPADFARTGIHTEIGSVILSKQLHIYNDHLEHHLGFIARKRAKLGL